MINLFQDDVLSFFGNHKTIVDTCVRLYLSRDMTKPTKCVCAQRRLRSAWASVRPSSLSSATCQQTTSSLKPRSRFLPYFTDSIYRQGKRITMSFYVNRIRTLIAMAAYSCHWLIMWKNENWHLLLSHCRYFDKTFTELLRSCLGDKAETLQNCF